MGFTTLRVYVVKVSESVYLAAGSNWELHFRCVSRDTILNNILCLLLTAQNIRLILGDWKFVIYPLHSLFAGIKK